MICAIVLAAGRSRRMGTQKLLLSWGNKTVIAQVVDEILRGPVQKVFVIVGDDGEPVAKALAGRDVSFVSNPNPESEMLESVRCGLRVLPADCVAVLVAMGDQPTITAELLGEIVRAFRETNRGIVIPTFEGRRGHPMLFAARFRDEVMGEFNGEGLSGLRQKHSPEVLELPAASAHVLEDLDTPADYERLHARQFSPTSGE